MSNNASNRIAPDLAERILEIPRISKKVIDEESCASGSKNQTRKHLQQKNSRSLVQKGAHAKTEVKNTLFYFPKSYEFRQDSVPSLISEHSDI
jgi:hypothetical protein